MKTQNSLKRVQPKAAMAFNPNAWAKVNANCYSYALGLMDHGASVPGQLKTSLLSPELLLSAETVREGLAEDGLVRIAEHQKDPRRSHIIAAFMRAKEDDFHFYHLHKDNVWSQLQVISTGARSGGLGGIGAEQEFNHVSRRHLFGVGSKIRAPQKDAALIGYPRFLGYYAIPEEGIEYYPRAAAI